jgi:hypothetical protein
VAAYRGPARCFDGLPVPADLAEAIDGLPLHVDLGLAHCRKPQMTVAHLAHRLNDLEPIHVRAGTTAVGPTNERVLLGQCSGWARQVATNAGREIRP